MTTLNGKNPDKIESFRIEFRLDCLLFCDDHEQFCLRKFIFAIQEVSRLINN